MSVRDPRSVDLADQVPQSSTPAATAATAATTAPTPVPRTRVGAAWVGVCAAVVIVVMLIVFMAQNTRSVQVNFLGMTANTALALALLIAAVGGSLLTLVVGTARITQLRRVVRARRR